MGSIHLESRRLVIAAVMLKKQMAGRSPLTPASLVRGDLHYRVFYW